MLLLQGLIATAAMFTMSVVGAPHAFTPFDLHGGTLMDVAFTRDRQTMYATYISASRHYSLVESHRVGASWSTPRTLPFSGRWRDLEEVLSPDGRYMVFASNRPISGGVKPLDAFYFGRYSHARGGNLWIVKRDGDKWGNPTRLPDAVNANSSTFSPALAADGTLYFMRASGKKGYFHLFVANLRNGVYNAAERAPFADQTAAEFDPTVAPDGSFVIFSSTRNPLPRGSAHLFISYNRSGSWSRPVDLGHLVNAGGDDVEPRLSPDLSQLYYSSAVNPANLRAPIPARARNRLLVITLLIRVQQTLTN